MIEQGLFTSATFKGQTIEGKIEHLKKELQEILDNPGDLEEVGDAFAIICDIAQYSGLTGRRLLDIAFAKLEVNKGRELEGPLPDGSYRHVKKEAV